MPMTIRRLQQQHTGVQTFNRVEAIADGAVIVDGKLLDLRGARGGASVYDHFVEYAPHEKYVLLNRDPDDGSWICEVATTHTGAASSNDTVVSSYPHAIIGNTGQSPQSFANGNITQTDGLRVAFQTAHEQLIAWGQGLDALSRYYPQAIVNAGHDWLYWAGHIAAYMIAHSNTYTWAQKMKWAETVITGAADVASPAQFYANTAAHTAPTRAQTWVNPTTGAKVNLVNAVNLSGTPPTISQLDNGGWITSLTA